MWKAMEVSAVEVFSILSFPVVHDDLKKKKTFLKHLNFLLTSLLVNSSEF